MDALRKAGLGEVSHLIGTLNARDEIRFTRGAKAVFAEKRIDLHRAWSERNWTVAVLFAGLLLGSWVMVIANVVNPIVGSTQWLRIATWAILTGLLPVIAARAALRVAHATHRRRWRWPGRMRDMVEASSDWLWEMGPDLRFTSLSHRIPGLNKADVTWLIGKTWHEAVNTEFDPAAWSRHADLLAQRRPFRDFVYLDKTPSGELRWRKVSGRPFVDQRGQFQGYRGTGTDVTEQMQAETKLRKALKDKQESEDKFRSLVADFPGAVYRCDCDAAWAVQFISDAIEVCAATRQRLRLSRSRGLPAQPDDRAMVETSSWRHCPAAASLPNIASCTGRRHPGSTTRAAQCSAMMARRTIRWRHRHQ
jgi:PAS domain S-box-containing protein